MSDPEFKVAVGLSREWDAHDAGVEVNTIGDAVFIRNFFNDITWKTFS